MNSLLILLFTLFSSVNSNPQTVNNSVSANEVLNKVQATLNSLKNIRYTHHLQINYPSKAFTNELSGKTFLDFTSEDKILGFKYFFEDEHILMAFNGTESFLCDKENKTLELDNKPAVGYFETVSFLNHSILSVKNALPWIIADNSIEKKIEDTVINNTSYHNIHFVLNNEMIGTLGERWKITKNIKLIYNLLVDKQTMLPVSVYQQNNIDDDVLKTEFSEIKLNPGLPDESVLYFSHYLNDYKIKDEAGINEIKLLKPGQTAPSWQLPDLKTDKTINSSDYTGKVLLLEFWIRNCSYCIENIPKLNELGKKYKNRDFKIITINASDSKEVIEKFKTRFPNIEYDILYNGEAVTKQYGVPAYPMIFLIDKSGKILYTGHFDKPQIEKTINAAL